jgi:GTPase SAR1 family protein
LYRAVWPPRLDCKLIVVGLDNSGKSSIIGRIKPSDTNSNNSQLEVTPTVGCKVEIFKRSSLNVTAFDMSGQVGSNHFLFCVSNHITIRCRASIASYGQVSIERQMALYSSWTAPIE